MIGTEKGVSDPQAAWQAQQQHVTQVLKSMDRAALIGDSPTRGAADARVVLVEFSDFQCPYCASAATDMKTFMAAHASDVLFVYKHFPLSRIHPEALPAAKAAWAADQQGQFWAYHDALFADQAQLGESLYVKLAEEVGLDVERFNRDRNSPAAAAAVDRDLQLARQLNLNGTPTFLMNNLWIPGGAPLEFFEEALVRLQADPSS
jgi:protein-disulfide isomerase